LSFIVKDLGTTVGTGWLPTANTLAIAAVAPFVGYLQDLFGKRYIALFGALLLCIGCAVVGSAHSFGAAVVGMALSGAGAGIGELTGLAGYVLKFFSLPNLLLTNSPVSLKLSQ
jgi:MFS family permease